MIAQAAALLAIALWPTVPVLIAASLVYGYGIGHITTLGPVVMRREFGAAAFGATYGAAATAIQLTSAFGPALFGLLRDSFGGYGPGLAIAAAVTLTACDDPVRGRAPGGTNLSHRRRRPATGCHAAAIPAFLAERKASCAERSVPSSTGHG